MTVDCVSVLFYLSFGVKLRTRLDHADILDLTVEGQRSADWNRKHSRSLKCLAGSSMASSKMVLVSSMPLTSNLYTQINVCYQWRHFHEEMYHSLFSTINLYVFKLQMECIFSYGLRQSMLDAGWKLLDNPTIGSHVKIVLLADAFQIQTFERVSKNNLTACQGLEKR